MRPSGTVTLLFTDIEGSTARWERHREAMGEAVRRHDELLRAAIESHGGYVFKTIGDTFCAAFTRVAEGIAAALDGQYALQRSDFSAVGGIRVRMALHAGTCEERDGDYFGHAVNRVARLLSVAHGGQIVLSGAAAELAKDVLGKDSTLVDYGLHRLKDLSHPEHVFGLVGKGLPADFPPLRSLSTMANNLPRYLTPIIGREREVGEIETLLRESQIVTIVGTGGIGKTRAAVQVAAHATDGSAHGVWFVDLAPLSDPALIASTVASAIGLQLPTNQDPDVALVVLLKTLDLLVVLDNCEHLITHAAPLAERIARSCPHVTILATSREPLAIAGETVYRLDTLGDMSAAALFVSRAQHADRRFKLLPDEVPVVIDICRRLDGIALAIELAAARAHVMPLRQLAERLDQRFRLLTGGDRAALPRQQTMRALIDWSYNLLSENERAVFRRLGVLAGTFTLEAAGGILGDAATESWEAFDRLTALVDKSMVAHEMGSERYRLYESIRQYAMQKLAEAGEIDEARAAHARLFADLAAQAEASFGTPGESEEAWFARYEPDLDNFRAAFDWALGTDVDLAARMTGNLTEFWRQGGFYAEGLARSEAVITALGERADEPEALEVWLAVSKLALRMGAFRRGMDAANRAFALAKRMHDTNGLAESGHLIVALRNRIGLERTRNVEDMAEAVERYRSVGRPLPLTQALGDYAFAFIDSDPERGRAISLEALAQARANNWSTEALRIETNLAEIEFISGHVESAIERARRVVDRHRQSRAHGVLTTSLSNLGCYLCATGHYDEAATVAGEAMSIARAYDWAHGCALSAQALAVVRAARGDARVAAQLLGYVDAHYDEIRSKREPTEETLRKLLIELLRARLDDRAIEAEITIGRTLSEDAACDIALGEAPLTVRMLRSS